MPPSNFNDALASQILERGKKLKGEENLKIAIEKLLEPALRALNIEIEPQYEKRTVLRGSQDAVYGNVIIEYEPPGAFKSKAKLLHARQQLVGYMSGFAAGHAKKDEALRRVVGVGIDGLEIFFLRYSPRGRKTKVAFPKPAERVQLALIEDEAWLEGFHMQGPYRVSPETIAMFLDYLRALAKLPLTPEAVADVFGPRGEPAKLAVNIFYKKIRETDNPKAKTLFAEWQRIFGVVYGQELGKAEKDATKLAQLYGVTAEVELKPLLFSVHTYFALIMKFLAAELASLQEGALLSSFVLELVPLASKDMHDRLSYLEDEGGLLNKLGIVNFLEGDFFGWYLATWDSETAEAIREVARKLSLFEPTTATLEPEATKDLLKRLYQYLIPREIRHDLGEYYTPDWLAERLLDQLHYQGELDKRLLDPSCGSGTFLVLAIKQAREYADVKAIDPKEAVDAITRNIIGFDLNPLAVIAARTNYLLALGRLRRLKAPLEIPVYLCDSVLTPAELVVKYGSLFPDENQGYRIPTTQGDFQLPLAVVDKEKIEQVTKLIDACVRDSYSVMDFATRLGKTLPLPDERSVEVLKQLYQKILDLEKQGKNRIWTRIIKNAFAPIFVGKFDLVAGNPPWVNWESLADEYRKATAGLWKKYEMQASAGNEVFELGKQKRDLSMLFTYACADNYLKKRGQLGFVITQTVFKTSGGEVFRHFKLSESVALRVVCVDDMVELQPFEGATNRTSVVVLQRDNRTSYPVPYTLWKKAKPGRIPMGASLGDAIAVTKRFNLHARPIREKTDLASPWVTGRTKALKAIERVVGKAAYKAWAGCCTWANGIYWVRIEERRADGLVVIRNLHDVGKQKVKTAQEAVEAHLLYPLLRGRDVERWMAKPSCCIVFPHTKDTSWEAISEGDMRRDYGETYHYLQMFRTELIARSGYRQLRQGHPFYILGNTNAVIHHEWKVVWREQADLLTPAVVHTESVAGERKPVLPDHKLMYVPVGSEDEAHYICALLASVVCQFIVKAYVVETSTSTHVLDNIAIPTFDSKRKVHRELARLSHEAHRQRARGADTKAMELGIDQQASQLWGLSGPELQALRDSLEILCWSADKTTDGADRDKED